MLQNLAEFLLICLISSCVSTKDMFYQNKVIADQRAWKAQRLPQNSLASLMKPFDWVVKAREWG